jgi:thiamine pyrophosphokinase
VSAGRLAAVFLGGSYEEAGFYVAWARAARLVVAADGGARFLLAEELRPDVVVGDFDSLSSEDARRLEETGVPLVRHPVRKDVTDGELATDEALRRGADELVLAGALGALDHMLGHLAILRRLAEGGVQARLVAPGLTGAVAVAPGRVALRAEAATRVSVVPLGVDAVVSLTGFEYDLDHGRLPASSCLGLGNAVATVPAEVRVHSGSAALLVESGLEDFGGTAAPGVAG